MLLEEAAIPNHACYNVHVKLQLMKMQCKVCVCVLVDVVMYVECLYGVRGEMHLHVCAWTSYMSAYICYLVSG